ncbi:hypothetical protein F2Q69_00021148 [Brassica cretica]|uniref:Uncharacterized protein n=1 Tax=Brassica cretica TaxID=69181 RepID=A0A8S9Q9C9_BRACR|nr:hypothetical protein F2Q69_00021148 [Brassica cretica]
MLMLPVVPKKNVMPLLFLSDVRPGYENESINFPQLLRYENESNYEMLGVLYTGE